MVTIRFEGAEELYKNLNALSARISRRVVTEALLEGGEPIRRMAEQNAPRAPGAPDVAEHINIGPIRRRPGQSDRESSVGIGVPREFFYDFFLEYGTVRMQAQPFYRPAFDGEAPDAIGIIGRVLWRELAARGVSRSVTAPSRPTGGRLL